LSEQLEFLQITKEVSERSVGYMDEMSTAPVPVNENNEQIGLPKNIVSNSG